VSNYVLIQQATMS